MRQAMRQAMRRSLILVLSLLAVLAFLAAGDTLLWRFAETQLETGFAAWAATARARGWTVTTGTPRRRGWPLAASLVLPGASLARDGLGWSADRVVLTLALRHPRTLTVAAEGGQSLRLGLLPAIPFSADRFRYAVALQPPGQGEDGDFDADHLRIGPPGGAATVTTLHIHDALRPDGLSWTLAAGDIDLPVLPDGRAWALGNRIGTLALDGTLTGLIAKQPTPYASAAAWRDAGGALALRNVALKWGALDLSGTVTLGLDAQMQPRGTASLHVTRPEAALDALAAGGVIAPRGAGAAKAILALMERTPPDGPPQLDTTLALTDRRLSIGRIPLLDVPELHWPGGP